LNQECEKVDQRLPMKSSAKYFCRAAGPKPTSFMTSLTKNTKPPIFFSLQTRRLAKSFEGLNHSLAQAADELFTW